MNLREHLFYQRLLNNACTMRDAVRTFEKVLTERSDASLPDLQRLAVESDDPETTYGALIVQSVFDGFADAQVLDFINLVHKEASARRVSKLLHTNEVNLKEVEIALREFSALPLGESQVSPSIAIGIRVQLISSFISENLFYVGVAKHHITMRDVDGLLQRVVGMYGQRSRIGGKSAGMILANRILKPVFGEPTGFEDQIEEVESRYLTAQVFNRFIEHNKLEEGHALKYMEPDERDVLRSELELRFARGEFPEDTAAALQDILRDLGDGPLIVRSSSLLEDSMGFPFYGKYESVFISNQGTPEERLAELIRAIKRVYVSILSSSVIEYRKDKALLDYDDMMSVLIQQVVGRRFGKYFFPATAGVVLSRNQYCWSKRINPADGVARIVHGLGTRAVDRGGDDYPRLVPLGEPKLRPEGSIKEVMKYSQRYVDVLNLESRELETVHFVDLYNHIRDEGEEYTPRHALSLVVGNTLATPGIYPGSVETGGAAITFDGLLTQGSFADVLKGAVRLLEDSYGVPVDVEFAHEGDKLYILQCRPLVQGGESGKVVVPKATESQQVLFAAERDIFRSAELSDLRYVVHVDGAGYNALTTHADKLEVARLVGRVNRALGGERFIIMGPGRWGSVNLDLGVKVGYGDINNCLMLVEIAMDRGGYRPEVSYGTHFFQDLVEADIIPLPLYPGDDGTLDVNFLEMAPNSLLTLVAATQVPDEHIQNCVRVVDLDTYGPGRLSVYLNAGDRGIALLG